jgi:deoxyguanosine kinase
MTNPFQRYPFIAIEGNIGSGKTTFCHQLAERFECNIILEQFTDNPFLPFFYQQPERYAFPVELFFMTERHKQLQEHFAKPNLFEQASVADYFFVKTLLFAKNNLNDEEFRLFQRLFGVLTGTFPKPDLLVYLHRPMEVLLHQIQQRGRNMEQNIAPDYLEEIQNAYMDYFRTETGLPILVIELGATDFQRDANAMAHLVGLLDREYGAGLNVVGV